MSAIVLRWLGIVGVICLALIPIRLYILSAPFDWVEDLLLVLGIVFIAAYFALLMTRKPRTATSASSP